MSIYVLAALRRHVRARFMDRCAYCLTAEALIAAIFEIEHIIPRSAGGETVFDNLCLACPTRVRNTWALCPDAHRVSPENRHDERGGPDFPGPPPGTAYRIGLEG